MAALRADRITHAYLFSGPRGCGKTTSARILARCLNCAEGPTDTPCGVCPSCVDLARGGSGSLDVVEIDAASHNGVDDARELRERASYAPVRDRYKVFILDEAHMVTPQGFNALLKLVEEPPEHVKFIFATTEPEKVIGTIRSRTHHYPFRLVGPRVLVPYLKEITDAESVAVADGVLEMVVRAGGGSVRDSLSVLDQLVAGATDGELSLDRASALLGYTDSALLDSVVDSLIVRDGAALFSVVDDIVATGHDPRRFVEDLLERLRDLVVVAVTGEQAEAALRGIPLDQLTRMQEQANRMGAGRLVRAADLTNAALTEMTGATSPRLHLELLCARILLPGVADAESGLLARVETLEQSLASGAIPAPDAGRPGRSTGSAPAGAGGGGQGDVPPAAGVGGAVGDSAVGGSAGAGRPARGGDRGIGSQDAGVQGSGPQAGAPRPGGSRAEGARGDGRGAGPAASAPSASAPAEAPDWRAVLQAPSAPPVPTRAEAATEAAQSGAAPSQGASSPAESSPAEPSQPASAQPGPSSAAPGQADGDRPTGDQPVGGQASDGEGQGHASVHVPPTGGEHTQEPATDRAPGAAPESRPEPAAEPAPDPEAAPGAGDEPAPGAGDEPAPEPTAASTAPAVPVDPAPGGGIDAAAVRARWSEVVDILSGLRRASWALVSMNAVVGEVSGTSIRLDFPSAGLAQAFTGGGHTEPVEEALSRTFGVRLRATAGVGGQPGGEQGGGSAGGSGGRGSRARAPHRSGGGAPGQDAEPSGDPGPDPAGPGPQQSSTAQADPQAGEAAPGPAAEQSGSVDRAPAGVPDTAGGATPASTPARAPVPGPTPTPQPAVAPEPELGPDGWPVVAVPGARYRAEADANRAAQSASRPTPPSTAPSAAASASGAGRAPVPPSASSPEDLPADLPGPEADGTDGIDETDADTPARPRPGEGDAIDQGSVVGPDGSAPNGADDRPADPYGDSVPWADEEPVDEDPGESGQPAPPAVLPGQKALGDQFAGTAFAPRVDPADDEASPDDIDAEDSSETGVDLLISVFGARVLEKRQPGTDVPPGA
ncbi:DNA polymerase III subunits gamma and tau [Actinomycetales bacterium JB111]|nr:DNA polymerase III subunits gamma and tau [Actinomycetales bacterium JB111]